MKNYQSHGTSTTKLLSIPIYCFYPYHFIHHLKSGKFTSHRSKTVYGVGFSGGREFNKSNSRKILSIWSMMLGRWYDDKMRIKNPSYKNCIVSDEWHNYQNYAKWYTSNEFYKVGWEVDKDLRKPGNRIYSEDTCTFVPPEINSFVPKNNIHRGEYPIGVYWHKSSEKFVSRCSIGKHVEYLGSFDCQIKAFNIYKLRKESYAKELAKKYKENIHNEVFFYIDGLLSEYR